jgi:CheY-like chemotaxis protein
LLFMAYRILLVEDETLIRMTLAEMLEEAGYVVVEAATGDEACTLMHAANGFDVLLTDIQMPGKADGIEVAQHFHAHHPNAPVVFMTGRPDMLSRIGQLTHGEALLRKPFRPRQMLDALDGLLTRPS